MKKQGDLLRDVCGAVASGRGAAISLGVHLSSLSEPLQVRRLFMDITLLRGIYGIEAVRD